MYFKSEKYKAQKDLNDELTRITGVKHYPTIGEAFEAKFKELGIIDQNGKVVEENKNETEQEL